MNWQMIYGLMKKDWAESFKSLQIVLFVIGMPLVLVVIVPALLTLLMMNAPMDDVSDLEMILGILPPLTNNWEQLTLKMQITVLSSLFSQFFIFLVPIMVTSFIAADAIVGEKERETIEALFALPMTDSDILLAKILSSVLPALFSTWIFSLFYVLIIDILTYPAIHFVLLPDLRFILLLIFFTPLLALLTVIFVVLISSRVSNTRDAQQLTGILVLPLIIIIIGQMFLILYDIVLLSIGIAILGIAVIISFYMSTRIFNREKIMTAI